MSNVLAVDVGGTNIKCAVFDRDLTIVESRILETPSRDESGKAVVDAIKDLTRELRESFDLVSVGLAVPGTLDEPRGIARWAGNLGWRDIAIVSMLENAIQLPIAFRHDVRAGALAELRSGALKGIKDGIFLPVGTGIACAIILDGEIRASEGFAGEIGHINVGSHRECVCGQDGCLEATSSTLAISKEYEKKSGTKLSTNEIVNRISQDQCAREVYDEAIDGLVMACDILATLLAPEVVVIGGGFSMAGSSLILDIENRLANELSFQRKPRLTLAHFGIQSGMYGCGIMAWEKINGK